MGSSQASGIPGGYPASTVRRVPAIVAAGDAKAARAIYGESKAYLEVGGAHARRARGRGAPARAGGLRGLGGRQRRARLEKALGEDARCSASCASRSTIVPQFRNLYENAWETYRRALPGARPGGPRPDARGRPSSPSSTSPTDLPFATPQEISEFVRQGARDRRRLRARPRHRGVDARRSTREARQAAASTWPTSTCARAASARATCTS